MGGIDYDGAPTMVMVAYAKLGHTKHGFRNRTLRKRAYGGGIANCSKTALLFSLRSRQSSGMATAEGLDQAPSSIIGGASS